MRHLTLIVYTITALALAEIRVDVQKKPSGASYDQQTGKWTLDKDIEEEDVMTNLLMQAAQCGNTLKICTDDKVCKARLEAAAKELQAKAEKEKAAADKKAAAEAAKEKVK